MSKAEDGTARPEALKVLERLEVGPARSSAARVMVPYTAVRAGESHTFEFIYRFEDPLPGESEVASLNLASMMGAQPALNYGLFCDEIVFHGPFDGHDRRFLEDMAKNTAREIYVKKFLEPNPFLRGSVSRMEPMRKESYLQARLVFPDELAGPASALAAGWNPVESRVAVLSSGGKESLLSFSLLEEIGQEVHPIFVNESGKHWFTALNSYREFTNRHPRTRRVWTNSDRLFAWMLRRLPFIREDFARVRSDEYPVRLWTVAVFLFGALPVLRARGIGALVIGDEFDTTVRASHRGIPHHDGLYDQSRYFDQAMTRYFQRKGWDVQQFSILRPLSELLVQKTLVERYPEVQRLQVSCHAAHVEGETVRPCGRCEKCSRVVGMLVALGSDPTRCGYEQAQIPGCIERLLTRGLTQETPGQEHLAHLLAGRGLVPPGLSTRMSRRGHGEIMKLRFDPERSPMDDIPTTLREPIYRILLEHADGAVRRDGRRWADFDPLKDPVLNVPYPFERKERSGGGKGPGDVELAGRYLLGELTWPEAEKRFRQTDVALLPVGAIEQHGPHLPLDTDAYDADHLCRAVAERCLPPRPLVLPLVPYGVSYHHEDFSGTISIGPDTLARLVHEIGMSAARNGITKLVIINGHGGNAATLHFAAQLINRDAHIFTCVDSGETSDADIDALAETVGDVHAGEIETSTSLATRPHLVEMSRARKFVPKFSNQYLDFSSKRSVDWYARTARISPSGVLGDPTRATRQKGERMWEIMIEHLVSFVQDLQRMSLDEIHQKSRF